jgi:SNF2 family DNA or RNA helicase
LIAATGHALITDEPGTGKTITTILGLAEWALAYQDTNLPILIICPASVVDPWVEAFRNWAPYWATVAWRGAPTRRKDLIGHADVYVTSYDTARMDAKDTNPSRSPLIALNPRALVADECHLIKTQSSQRSQAVRRLARNVKAFVALSGTPITHHPADLWPTLTCLAPGAYPSRERWVVRYCLTTPADYGETILGLNPGNEAEFRLSLLGQQRRVAKADVLDQLPPKVYSVRTVELPPAYRKAYDAMENDMLAELPDGQEMSVMDVLAQLTCLSALACAAADVEITYTTNDAGEQKRHQHIELKAPSWKVDALLEVLEERPGKPVVAFAPSAQLMRLSGAKATQAGLRVGYVIGGQTMTDRTATVAKFQQGGLDLICATTGAGGVGITLTAASTVVFLQRPWSLVESIQAEDRCHRIGSEIHDSIEIVDIVAANTIDTRVRSVLREKAGQLADLVQDPRIVAELLGGASIHQLRKKAS